MLGCGYAIVLPHIFEIFLKREYNSGKIYDAVRF